MPTQAALAWSIATLIDKYTFRIIYDRITDATNVTDS